jgi:hypothetical protein
MRPSGLMGRAWTYFRYGPARAAKCRSGNLGSTGASNRSQGYRDFGRWAEPMVLGSFRACSGNPDIGRHPAARSCVRDNPERTLNPLVSGDSGW